MLLLIACQGAFALQSPTITGLVALSDTSAWLTWHSNDPATTGFYIHRVDPFMSSSRIIDTLPAADTEYIAIVSPAETCGLPTILRRSEHGIRTASPSTTAVKKTRPRRLCLPIPKNLPEQQQGFYSGQKFLIIRSVSAFAMR